MLWRRRLHGCGRGLGWTAGVLVILFAVLAALAQLLLPLLARHPAWVAAQLSQRLQRPVSFASMEGRWTASGPEFVMHGVVVGPAAGERGARNGLEAIHDHAGRDRARGGGRARIRGRAAVARALTGDLRRSAVERP